MALRNPKKTETDTDDDNQISAPLAADKRAALVAKVESHVHFLESAKLADRAESMRVIREILNLAVNAVYVDIIVKGGAIPVLVKHLKAPPMSDCVPCEHQVEIESATTLLRIAFVVKQNKQLIVDSGALTNLVDLLKRHKHGLASSVTNRLILVAVKVIGFLAYGSNTIQASVRMEGGIPPLVHFLQQAEDKTVQTAAALALVSLSLDNAENTNQIVECNAVPTLISMLRSKDTSIHRAALHTIFSLAESSNIMHEGLLSRAIQPVIGLLSSCCSESQYIAASILYRFEATHPNCKIQIVQRGAVTPLVKMLGSPEGVVRNISVFLLERLALDKHNQAGIVHNCGLVELLKLLDSTLQETVASALYHLAENEDNVYDFIMLGGVQRLQEGFIVETNKDLVANILTRLEENLHGDVLNKLVYLMVDEHEQERFQIAPALAHFCASVDIISIFVDHDGLKVLIGLLRSSCSKQQQDGATALCKLAKKALTLSPPSPTPQVSSLMLLCENTAAQHLSVEKVCSVYDISEYFNAVKLRDACILFILEHFQELRSGDYGFNDSIITKIHDYLLRLLQRPTL